MTKVFMIVLRIIWHFQSPLNSSMITYFVIDVRSYSCWGFFKSMFPWTFSSSRDLDLDPAQYLSRQQYVLCCSSAKQWAGRACVHSMGVSMNAFAAWLSLHYLHSWTTWKFFSIIYWLRALFDSGGRESGGGKDEIVCLWRIKYECYVIHSEVLAALLTIWQEYDITV